MIRDRHGGILAVMVVTGSTDAVAFCSACTQNGDWLQIAKLEALSHQDVNLTSRYDHISEYVDTYLLTFSEKLPYGWSSICVL